MRGYFGFFVAFLVSYALAGKYSGGAERCFLYSAYLAEYEYRTTLSNPGTYAFQIAPDCVGSPTNGMPYVGRFRRCTFGEFLKWVDNLAAIPKLPGLTPTNFPAWDVQQCVIKTETVRPPRNIDVSRLYPGATGFGPALKNAASRINDARAALFSNDDSKLAALFRNADSYITIAWAYRASDVESRRLTALGNGRAAGTVKTTTVQLGISQGTFQMLDAKATAKAFGQTGAQFWQTIRTYFANNNLASSHVAMVRTVRLAAKNMGCKLPTGVSGKRELIEKE